MKLFRTSSVFEMLRFWIVSLVLMQAGVAIAQTGSVVTVNSDLALVINGRKVFPIGFSPGPPTNGKTPGGDDALDELRGAGALLFRMAQSTDWNSQVISNQQAALDWAGQHGMYVWLNLRELSKFSATDTNTPAKLRSTVSLFKNHPALGLWKNFDEAWWGGVSEADLQRGYEVIKQEDPNHPVVQTHAPRGTLADLQPYNAATDILALDIYPVGVPPGANSLLANKEISMVGDYAQFLDAVGNREKQFWMIEQIAWSGVTPPTKTLVFPTFRQSRYMAYQAIINGARGLMFFGGNIAATLNEQDLPLGWNWTFWNAVLKPVVQEIGDNGLLAEALAAPGSALPITMSGTTFPDLEFCVREAPPYFYILASKREGATTNVTFSGLPIFQGAGEVLYESSRTVPVQNAQFTDSFAPFDVHVYRFLLTNQSPFIISPPQSRTNYSGTTATFSVTAGGTGPLSYQWRKESVSLSNGGNVSGANSAALTLLNVSQSDAANYDVIVSGVGSVTSAPPTMLTVITNQSPIITAQPQSRTNIIGSVATFSVIAEGSGPLTYQWRKNGFNLSNAGNISGANSSTLFLSNVTQTDANDYDVVVSGFGTSTSSIATLTVVANEPPSITSQPQSRTNNAGTTAAFGVTAEGAPPLLYQWFKNGIDLVDNGNISGSTSSTLTVAVVTSIDAGSYSVVVYNPDSGDFQFSSNATLKINFPMPYYDPFEYVVGSNLGGQINGNYLLWSDIGTSTTGPFVTVQYQNLPVPGLKPSVGNAIQFGGLGKSARFSFPSGNPVATGTLYYSFALQVVNTNGLDPAGTFIGGFNNSVGTQTGQPTVIGTRVYLRSVTNGFNIGLAKASSTATDWVWDPRVFATNEIVFVVGSYTFGTLTTSDDVSKLWINPNPTNFAASLEPSATLTNSIGADIGSSQVASFVFLQRSASEPALMRADELRIGRTWAEVTPVMLPTLTEFKKISGETFQFSYTDGSLKNYNVYASDNLLTWTLVGAASQISPGTFRFDHTNANGSQRFYQLRSP